MPSATRGAKCSETMIDAPCDDVAVMMRSCARRVTLFVSVLGVKM